MRDSESARRMLHGVVDQLVDAWRTRPEHGVTPVDATSIRGRLDRYPLDQAHDIEDVVPDLLAALDRWTVHTDHPGGQ